MGECVCVCGGGGGGWGLGLNVWCHVKHSNPAQGVFSPHVQCSWNRPCIHHDPDLDKGVIEDT